MEMIDILRVLLFTWWLCEDDKCVPSGMFPSGTHESKPQVGGNGLE